MIVLVVPAVTVTNTVVVGGGGGGGVGTNGYGRGGPGGKQMRRGFHWHHGLRAPYHLIPPQGTYWKGIWFQGIAHLLQSVLEGADFVKKSETDQGMLPQRYPHHLRPGCGHGLYCQQ